MRKQLISGFTAGMLLLGTVGMTQAALITSEDFEGGATGWSNNATTAGGGDFSTFLGRFGGSGGDQRVFKNYALSGTQTEVTISFDFYEIDSWDGELFMIYVDDVVLQADQFQHTKKDVPSNATNIFGNGFTDHGFSGWSDQGYRYSFTVSTASTNLKLGFGSYLNQAENDESWGIDNVVIEDNSTVDPIPEPATMVLFGAGLVGLAGYRRRTTKG